MRISKRRWGLGVLAGWLIAVGLPGTSLHAAEKLVISEVEVRSEEGLTRVVLRGAEDPIYTAFMRQNPPRLIVDLPDVVFADVETPIEVRDGLVEDITLGAFGDPRVAATMARISISLAGDTDYEVIPNGDEIVIELRSLEIQQPAPDRIAMEPEAARPEPSPVAPETPTPEQGTAVARAEPAPAPPPVPEPEVSPVEEPEIIEASTPAGSSARITKVVTHEDRVEIIADGPIDNVDSFALEEPDRIVVDLWGMQNGVWPPKFEGIGAIRSVRIGEHADKVRIVLDLATHVASHAVETTATGAAVVLMVGSGPTEEDDAFASAEPEPTQPPSETPWPEAPETEDAEAFRPPAEGQAAPPSESTADAPEETADTLAAEATEPEVPTPESEADVTPVEIAESAEVTSVHFESLPEVDRVVIELSARLAAEMIEPDSATIIVELPGATIDSELERRIDTREFGGPVEVFSAFGTPEVEGDQVRLVLKRRGSSTARLRWQGSQLWLEVPRGDLVASVRPDAPATPSAEEAAASAPAPTPGVVTPPPAAAQPPAPAEPVPAAPAAAEEEMGSGYTGPALPAAIDILEEGGFSREKQYAGRRISLDFKDADIGNILRLIAEVSDLNVIAGEEVSGNVTIRLVDVPWDQALDIILLTKGLGFVRIGNILRIAPIDVLQREEQARLQERRAKEKLEDLVVKLQPVNYADVTEVSNLVKRLLSGRGTVNVDRRTSTLIIKDIPSVIHEAVALVKAIDTQTPQVLIEAKIVEASLDFSRSLGTVWGVGYLDDPLDPTNTWGGEDLHLQNGGTSLFGGAQESNFLVGVPAALPLGTLTMGLLGFNDRMQLDLQIQAAETNSKGKVISSPRVVTLDNREAKIQQGVAIRFDASDGDSVSTSFVDAVLELAVTPHITADRSIIMKIKVSRNAPQLGPSTGEIVGIAKNETETEALVRDGQTMVLGGIYTVDSGKSSLRVPFLADIPIIGPAFRSADQSDVRRELLIFVTPRIVEAAPSAS